MKKLSLAIIVLIAIAAFAAADYFVNAPLEKLPGKVFNSDAADSHVNITQMLLDGNSSEFSYVISKRERVKQIFEKFDMSSLENVAIFKNTLDKKEGQDPGSQIIIYEIQGPQNQGRITYLNLKLKLIDQTDITGTINEVSGYGYNSFFYNDLNNENTGFLLAQIKDNLFGFQYNKSDDGGGFETVKLMVEALNRINLLT
jgi:hypothetical protein